MLNLKSILTGVLLSWCPGAVLAQPYFDVAGISGWQMPGSMNGDNVTETQGTFFVAVPFDVSKRTKLIVSPFYQARLLENEATDQTENLKSLSLPVTGMYQPRDSTWTFLAFTAFRTHSTQFRFNGDVFQVAGAVLVHYRVNPDLILKGGFYVSREFFGTFFIVLAGVEWKISDRMHLFGLINNKLKFEYKFTEKFYGGFEFRAINNSYREDGYGGYYKISDNHLAAFADIGIAKNLVWNIDAGHTMLRYIKSRNGADFPEINKDGFVFSTGLAYRIRLY